MIRTDMLWAHNLGELVPNYLQCMLVCIVLELWSFAKRGDGGRGRRGRKAVISVEICATNDEHTP